VEKAPKKSWPGSIIIVADILATICIGHQLRRRKRVRDLGLQNVSISQGEPHNPKLPAGSLDIAILVHMYHEIAQPYALLYNLVPAVKPDARRHCRRFPSHIRAWYPAKSPSL
jgi:hypothetical protein